LKSRSKPPVDWSRAGYTCSESWTRPD
jgi:hypothetical protein